MTVREDFPCGPVVLASPICSLSWGLVSKNKDIMKRAIFYVLTLWMISGALSCGSGPPSFKPSPGIVLLPTTVSLAVAQTQDFEATPINSTSAILFSVDGGDSFGTIDAAGLYTAPATVPPGGTAT